MSSKNCPKRVDPRQYLSYLLFEPIQYLLVLLLVIAVICCAVITTNHSPVFYYTGELCNTLANLLPEVI